MVNFALGKEIAKDVFQSSHELGTKKKFWVPTRNRTSDLRCSTAEPQRLYSERGHITRVLHTARISNVDSVMFVNRLREIVSFELGKKIAKDVFRLVTGVGQRWRYKHDAIDIATSFASSKLTISPILFTNMTLSTLLIQAVYRTRVIWTS